MAAFIATTALLSLAAVANAQSSNVTGSSSACPEYGGVHFIVARASTEAPGFGIIGAVKNAVVEQVPGSTAEAVDYPATLSDYFNSESAGVDAMKELVQSYTARCSAPLVLLGYSQGAQVALDTLVGQMDAAFATNDTIDDSESVHVLDQVAAAVVMGDPSFNTTETFHRGNATIHGLFPRQNVELFEQTDLAARVRSYCDAGDPYCAGGNFSQVIIHLTYLNRYQTDAVNFILEEIKAWYAAHPEYDNSATPSSCPTASSSALMPSRPTATPYGTGMSAPGNYNATKSGSPLGTPGVLPPTNVPSVVPATGGAAALKGSLATGALLGGIFAFLL